MERKDIFPPPEQHVLGGYTTWPARTAGLEVDAEPKIVETLVTGLEEASQKSRRVMQDVHGPYAKAILAASPIGYWRLEDEEGTKPRNAVSRGQQANLRPGFAFICRASEVEPALVMEKNSPHPSSPAILRSIEPYTSLEEDSNYPSLSHRPIIRSLLVLVGEKSGASERQGNLFHSMKDYPLIAHQDGAHRVS